MCKRITPKHPWCSCHQSGMIDSWLAQDNGYPDCPHHITITNFGIGDFNAEDGFVQVLRHQDHEEIVSILRDYPGAEAKWEHCARYREMFSFNGSIHPGLERMCPETTEKELRRSTDDNNGENIFKWDGLCHRCDVNRRAKKDMIPLRLVKLRRGTKAEVRTWARNHMLKDWPEGFPVLAYPDGTLLEAKIADAIVDRPANCVGQRVFVYLATDLKPVKYGGRWVTGEDWSAVFLLPSPDALDNDKAPAPMPGTKIQAPQNALVKGFWSAVSSIFGGGR
ncbi:hypothetical protein QBC34DRAFT_441411 [Podospora aff. communis PSN243]|uniref:Uncharacterized protein n=1 Tax=Podospora aff. communis PSN243 TaxID=3040156 RepID=A0AAV9GBF6_9PEZI|nr:hypothetical protein QBC34DRAFT_441411 [Podospora aff. communis PSN243]